MTTGSRIEYALSHNKNTRKHGGSGSGCLRRDHSEAVVVGLVVNSTSRSTSRSGTGTGSGSGMSSVDRHVVLELLLDFYQSSLETVVNNHYIE